jgi:hypothetical protein
MQLRDRECHSSGYLKWEEIAVLKRQHMFSIDKQDACKDHTSFALNDLVEDDEEPSVGRIA